MGRFWLALTALVVCVGERTAQAVDYPYLHAGTGGHVTCGVAATGWQQPGFDDRWWSEVQGAPDAGVCVGTRFQRWRFDIGKELPRLITLTLRVRYTHGFAAYLNGVEVARRRLDAAADPAALATETHGPEPESFFVPVSAGLLKAGGNTLALEVHPHTAGREPYLDVELDGTDGARLIRGPYLVRLGETEATLLFDTDLATRASLEYGASLQYGKTVASERPERHHRLRLTDLQPGTAYHYHVLARQPDADEKAPAEVDSLDAVFHTLPPAGRPLRFAVFGDVRSGHDVHALLDRTLQAEDPDFALVNGDMVDRGSDEGDWERFFTVAASLLRQLMIFPTPGNHEYARLGRGAAIYFALFRLPLQPGEEDAGYYSFDVAGSHFVALDSNQYRSPRMRAWFDRDLAAAAQRGANGVFVYAHEGPYSSGLHGDNQVAIADYVPIMEKHGVSMFFGGHDHHYERGRVGKLNYVITGGGGAELRNQRCGVPGRKPCPPRVLAIANEHNYVMVEVRPETMRVCPKRPDGSAIEPCVDLPLRRTVAR